MNNPSTITQRKLRIIAIVAAHNEGDVIYHVIRDLIEQGLEVYFINHCSTDNTLQEASKWLGKGLIHIENFPQDAHYPEQNKREYIWSHILKRKEDVAAALDADWFIHHDADEFRESPWPGLSLSEAIHVVDRSGYNAINFKLVNFHPTDNSFVPGTDVREALKYYKWGEEFDILQTKAWKKPAKPADLVSMAGHDIQFEGKRVYPIKFLLRHYPIRSQAHGLQKVFQERKKRFNAQERKIGMHIQYDEVTNESYKFLHNPAELKLYDGNEVRLLLLSEPAYAIKKELSISQEQTGAKTGLEASKMNRGNMHAEEGLKSLKAKQKTTKSPSPTTSQMTTVFILTVGDVTFHQCKKALDEQTSRDFKLDVISNYRPFNAAAQEMIKRCETEYFIQVDEDMILYPNAVQKMVEVMGIAPDNVGMVCFHLYDKDREQNIQGVKIYRTRAIKGLTFRNLKASEMDILEQMGQRGIKWILHPEVLGLHGTHYTPVSIYHRYKTLYEKDITSWNTLVWDINKKAARYRETGDPLQLFALLGAAHGIINAPHAQDAEKDFQEYNLKALEVFKRLLLTTTPRVCQYDPTMQPKPLLNEPIPLEEVNWKHPAETKPTRKRRQAGQVPTKGEESIARSSRVLIACTHFWPNVGGVEVIAENLGAQLVRLGYQVDVATFAHPDRTSHLHRGINIISLDTTPMSGNVPQWALQLRQFVTSGDYKACILLADPVNPIIWSIENAAIPPATRVLIQPIINQHGYKVWKDNHEFRMRLAAILKPATATIALTRIGTEMEYMEEEGIVPVYLPNAVDMVPATSNFRQQHGISEADFMVLHVANILKIKNHLGLLLRLQNMPDDWRLVMIGYPSGRAEYVDRVQEVMRNMPNVIHIPGLPPEDVSAAMQAADVVVLPSKSEVSPVTILEAMSHGKPWVATQGCGAVNDYAGGIVDTLERFPHILHALRREPDIRHALGNLGKRHWQACYTWEVVAKGWEELIETGRLQHSFAMPEDIAEEAKTLHPVIEGDSPFSPPHIKQPSFAPRPGPKIQPRPTVSVVIPCYNQAEFLPEAVGSLVAQTFADWECIIVNDGSTDNTSDVARGLIAKYPTKRMRLLEKENGGLAAARNSGIEAARGEYILPLDSDDMIHPEMLGKMAPVLDSNPDIGVVYGDLRQFGGGNKIIQAGVFNLKRLCTENQLSYCSLFRRTVWKSVGGYNTNMVWGYEDWDFWIGCAEKGIRGQRIPEALFLYRVKDSSMYTKALEHDNELKAQIVMNHPGIFNRETVDAAEMILNQLSPDAKPQTSCPIVSVIVPTFNRPDSLAETIKSVLNQTFSDYEIVVVNDAGEDVGDVVETLNTSGRITYVSHTRNKGLAASRNTGIRKARGKYIAYLDDDDIFYPDHLETLVKYLENSPYKVAYTDAHRNHQEKENNGKYVTKEKNVPYSSDFDYDYILIGNFVPVLCLMHEKDCVDEVGLFDESLTTHEDWDLWIRMSRKFKFIHIKKITCEFSLRTDGTSMTSGNLVDFPRTMEIIYDRYKEYTKHNPKIAEEQTHNLEVLKKKIDINRLTMMTRGDTLINQGKLDEAIKEFEKLVTLHPDYLDGHVRLANAFYKNGDLPEAEKCLLKAIELEPNNVIVLKDLARVYFDNKDYYRAISKCEAALLNDESDAETLVLLSNCYLEMNAHDAALIGFQKALELSPKHKGAKEGLSLLKEKQKTKKPRKGKAHPLHANQTSATPVVSVIVPCYNQAHFLPDAINSVVNQTYTNWECIIVNDGSPDNTTQVAESLIQKHPEKQIKHIKQLNQGLATARNTGIMASKGKYILPLDADDMIHPEMLQKTVALLDTHPEIAIAYTDARLFGNINQYAFTRDYNFEQSCFNNLFAYCSLYRREAWESVGGYNPNMVWGYEDWDFWIGCGEKGFFAQRITEPLFLYRVKDSSMYTKAREHHDELLAQIAKNHPNLYGKHGPITQEKTSAPQATGSRKLRVGYLGIDPRQTAGPAIRVKSALTYLSGNDSLEFVYLGDTFGNEFVVDTENLKTVDVVVIQREYSWDIPYRQLLKSLGNNTVKVVFDFDDALTHIPANHPDYNLYKLNRPKFEECMRTADLVTVSTERLKSLYQDYNNNMVVLPNCIDLQLWSNHKTRKKKTNTINIIFSGTWTHASDLALIEDVIIKVINDFGESVNFMFWGNATKKLSKYPQVKLIHGHIPNYSDYAGELQALNAHIGIIPLEDNTLNRAKSHIKWLEYSISKIPSICSNLEAYNLYVDHGKTGLLVNNTFDEWYNALKELITDPGLRKRIADNAYKEVIKKYTVEKQAHKWLDAYCTLFAPSAVTAIKDTAQKEPTPTAPAPDINTGLAASIINRGHALIEIGKLDEAIKEFKKLINLHPDHSDGYANLARAYYEKGDLQEAEKLFGMALELDPNNATARKNLSHLHFEKQKSVNNKPLNGQPFSPAPSPTIVSSNSHFETELRKLFKEIKPSKIIETGTHRGQGTSKIIWQAITDSAIPADFTTIEVNPVSHREAVRYFQQNGMNVRAELGLSIPRAMLPSREEIYDKFVQNKEHPSIFYDHAEDIRADQYFAETNINVTDNILHLAMKRYDFKPDFVLLDSSGHIGLIEFKHLMSLIKGDFYLMLDDTNHCKHFETLQAIKADPHFELMVESPEKFGFCIAKYTHATPPLAVQTDTTGDNAINKSTHQGNGVTTSKNRAQLHFYRKEFKQAISECEALLLNDPSDADTLALISDCYLETNAYEAALIGYQKALELSPKHNNAKKGLALLEEKLKTKEKLNFCTVMQNSPKNKTKIIADKKDSKKSKKIKTRTPDKTNEKTRRPAKDIVSIIMLTYNALDYTKVCLDSIANNTHYPHEIILVDNASTDGTVDYLRKLAKKHPNYKLIDNKDNKGYAEGNNQGVAAARGKYVVLLNNDVLVPEGWLESMVETLERHDRIGMVGPITNSSSGRQMVASVPYSDENGYFEYAQEVRMINKGKSTPRHRIAGFAVLMEKALYQEVGGLDTTFGIGNYEDDDLCLKVTEKGYAIMVDESVFIHHYGSRSFIENKIDYENSLSVNDSLFKIKWPDVDYDELLEIDDSLVNANVALLMQGHQALESGRADKAAELFTKVLETHPINETSLYGLGLAHQMNGKMDEAVSAFKNAIEHNPSYFNAYQSLAHAYKELDQKDSARACLEKAATLDAYATKQLQHALELHSTGDTEQAIRQIEKLLAVEPNNSHAHNDIGTLYYKQGKREKAFSHIQISVAIDPNNNTAMKNLAHLHFDRKNYTQAISACEAVLTKDGKDAADTLALLSNCYFETKAYEAALIGYQKALKLSPKHKEAKEGLTLVRSKLKYNK